MTTMTLSHTTTYRASRLPVPYAYRVAHVPKHAVRPTRHFTRWLRSELREIGWAICDGFMRVVNS